MCNWSKYTIRTQLSIIFGGIITFSLMTMSLVCVLYLNELNNTSKTNLFNNFLEKSKNDMNEITISGSNMFDQILSQLTGNFPLHMATNAEDSFRSDYAFDKLESYYNYPSVLVGASYDERYSANKTLLHSTFNVFNKRLHELNTLDTYSRNIINRTSQMDYLFRTTFKNSEDFFAGYISTTNKILRYYPGVVNNNFLEEYIMYDNIGDFWYETIINKPDEAVYTPPYYDDIARALMITIGRTIRNPSSGTIIGAFGSDLILTTIQENIKNLTYLNKGRALLFDISEYLIADSDNEITDLLTYREVRNPEINTENWNKLLENNDELLEIENYYLVSTQMKTSLGQYMIVSIIEKKYVLETFDNILTSVNGTIEQSNTILSITISLVIIFAVISTLFFAGRIINSIHKFEKMSRDIAKAKINGDMASSYERTGFREIDDVAERMRKETERPVVMNQIINQYYGKHQWETYFIKPLESSELVGAEAAASRSVATAPPPEYGVTNV
jgi:hypothetical protein